MKRSTILLLAVLVFVASVWFLGRIHGQCMDRCVAGFQGAYPEIACKYECSFFNKFKKPLKRP